MVQIDSIQEVGISLNYLIDMQSTLIACVPRPQTSKNELCKETRKGNVPV